MADANIRAVITAEDRASATLKRVGDGIDGVGGKAKEFLGGAVQSASLIAAAGLAAVGAAAVDVTKSFMESQNVAAQLNAVLTSTHGVAGLTIQDLNAQSSALQKLTKFSDEQIGSAQALLLTFTDLKGPVVKQATATVLDMSQALGEDLKSASIQVGKALQDPVLGITALRRVGVNFSDSQKEVIQNLVDTGQKAKAQQLILKELNTEFGGSAEAAGKTFAGQLMILRNQLDDVKEKVGEVIVNALAPFITQATQAVEAINWDEVIRRTIAALTDMKSRFMEFAQPLIDFYQQHSQPINDFLSKFVETGLVLIPTLATLGVAFSVLSNPLVILTGIIAGLWYLWEDHRTTFWALIAVLGPLTVAFVTLKAALLFSSVINDLTTAFRVLAGAEGIAAATGSAGSFTTAALGARSAAGILGAFLASPIAPVIFLVAGVAAIYGMISAAQQLKGELDELHAYLAREQAQINTYKQNVIDAVNAGDHLKAQQAAVDLYKAQDNQKNGLQFHRAMGGPVRKGEPYIVGEQRAELFVPNSDGRIVPNLDGVTSSGGGGDITANISFNGPLMGNSSEAREFAKMIIDSMKDVAGAKNTTVAEMLS